MLSALLAGQHGSPLLTHFMESREAENQSWAICQDEDQLMLFANRKGISAFDGIEWKHISIPTIPYAMQKNPRDGRIYIGGDGNFGYIRKDDTGSYTYVALSEDTAGTGIITRIIFSESHIWFYSDQCAIRWQQATGKPDLRLRSRPGEPFTGIFTRGDNTFLNVYGKGLHRLESDTLFPIVTGYLTEQTNILFALPFSSNMVLTGRSDGTLALFDGIKYYDYQVGDEGYISRNILSEGIALGDTAYAFSTLEGGVVTVRKADGKVIYTINNETELPDDEIYAIGSDISGGLWISHQYGLTRADMSLPLENFTIFPGLKGNLSSALKYGEELFVATSEGVFYLEEVKNYEEVQVLVRNTSAPSAYGKTGETASPPVQETGRKNIFSRIFGRKTSQPQGETATAPSEAPGKQPPVSYTRKTVRRLRSVNHLYRKVEGLNEKCRQLVATPHGILAATNKGLFVINEHRAEALIPGKYITYIEWSPYNGCYHAASTEGFYSIVRGEIGWEVTSPDPSITGPVYSVFQADGSTIWLGGENVVYRIQSDNGNTPGKISYYRIPKEFPDRCYVQMINDTVFLFSESEIHFFNTAGDRFDEYTSRAVLREAGRDYSMPLSNYPLLETGDRWLSMDAGKIIEERELSLLKLFDNIVYAGIEKGSIWIIDGRNRVFEIDRDRPALINPDLNILIKSVRNDRGISFNLSNVKLERGDNVIHFEIVAPAYLRENTIQYQYYIYKVMPGWSEWSSKTQYEKAIARPGDYILQVRAKDLWGNVSERKSLKFTIKAPITKTPAFYILAGLAGLSLVIFIIMFREKQLQIKNRALEERVRERTAELAAQKQEITASIEYAGRIQQAMLPMEKLFRDSFSDHFIFFKPRDIVSGDFYWIGEDDRSIFFTVADCTGHGVPGAFMSTMGISTLNEIIANNHNLQANTVLNLLRDKTMRALHQTGKIGEAADGMDVAFCVLRKDRKVLQYAGAFNPLILFQGGELKEYRADRMPIGIHYGGEKPFTNHVIPVNRGDTLYIFSDGYTDQFGGPEGVKYKMANFRKLLTEIYYRPMIEQRNILENQFEEWKGSGSQVDDITIIGIRL
ncbi:MAG: SpoIIE family protein phosphatase [Bacteroidales bacterium]|nr:SpoIIE family protein phosphatase [Bacteroidales bacterium]